MKNHILILGLLLIFVSSACQPKAPVCAEGSISFFTDKNNIPVATAMADASNNTGLTVEINGKPKEFDQVIHGPLCNNQLSGKVYIACDIQINAWENSPNFLDGCQFKVSPGSEVYVAAHNNARYFQGCDYCHRSNHGQKK